MTPELTRAARIGAWGSRHMTLGAVILAMTIMAGELMVVRDRHEELAAEQRRGVLRDATSLMTNRTDQMKESLRSLASFYAGSADVGPAELERFASVRRETEALELGWIAETPEDGRSLRLPLRGNAAIGRPSTMSATARAQIAAHADPARQILVIDDWVYAGGDADQRPLTLLMPVMDPETGRRRGFAYAVFSAKAIAIDLSYLLDREVLSVSLTRGYDATDLVAPSAYDGPTDATFSIIGSSRVGLRYVHEGRSFENYLRNEAVGQLMSVAAGLAMFMLVAVLITRQSRYARLAADAAFDANSQKSRFLATMSHEMRTPLNGVIGMADLIGRRPLDDDQRGKLNTLVSSAETLLLIINQLLDYIKVDADQVDLESVETDLFLLISDVAAGVKVLAADRGLSLVVNMPIDAPCFVMADPLRLRQMLTNLLSNAVKFTSSGHVALDVSVPERRGGTVVRFEVEDTGIGIPADKLDAVFEEFRQVDSSTTRTHGGTGLGLSITRRMAVLMGGTLEAESVQGQGSRFFISIPMTVVQRPRALRREIAISAAQKALLLMPPGPLRKALAANFASIGAEIVDIDAADIDAAMHAIDRSVELDDPFDLIFVERLEQADAVRRVLIPIAENGGTAPKVGWIRDSVRSGLPLTEDEKSRIDFALDSPFTAEQLVLAVIDAVVHGTLSRVKPIGMQRAAQRFDGARILLVDDDPVNQLYGAALLEDLGCVVTVAQNGALAIDAARAAAFDLMFMDCQMPVMDGYQATGRLRDLMRSGDIPPAPIVALTANAVKGDRERCIDAGMDDFLSKPVREPLLVAAMVNWIKPRPQEALPAPPPAEPEICVPDLADMAPDPAPAATPRAQTAAPPAPPPEDDIPVVDTAVFEGSRDTMGDRFARLLEVFLSDGEERIVQIAQALARRDYGVCARNAHTLKASGRMLGAARMTDRAVALERAAKGPSPDGAEVQRLAATVEEEFRCFAEAIRAVGKAA